jgi:phospholipase C
VATETFDHTSLIQFLEKRFGVTEPHISTWRRATCGDLTSAFRFSHGFPFPGPGGQHPAGPGHHVPEGYLRPASDPVRR